MLNLRAFMQFSLKMIDELYLGRLTESTETHIEGRRSGRKNKIKTCSKSDWSAFKDFLSNFEMLGEEGDTVLNEEACQVRNWMGEYSISRLTRIMLSWDTQLVIPRHILWALQVYEEVIRKDGTILNSSGHTVLPLESLVDQLASGQPLGYMAHVTRTEDDEDGIYYTRVTAKDLLQEMVDEGLLAYLPKGSDPKWGIYVPEYLALETEFVKQLSEPCEPAEIDLEKLDALFKGADLDQKKAIVDILTSEHVGHGLIGYPGGGKTWTCSVLANYYGPENVIALATTGAAALVLETQLPLGVKCTTISSAYYNLPNPAWGSWWTRSKYLIMDEASMLSMTFIEHWLAVVNRIGPVKILIVGDPKQLPPVGAGAMFENIVQGKMGVKGSVLHGQHRMDPKALEFLQSLECSVDWDEAARSRNNQGLWDLLEVASETHRVQRSNIATILAQIVENAETLETNAKKISTRVILSTYTHRFAEIINNLIEGKRLGCPAVDEFLKLIATYARNVTPEYLYQTGRAHKSSIPQAEKYIGNFLTKRVANPESKYTDHLAQIEEAISLAYTNIKFFVKARPLQPGAYVRCNRNIWFPQYSERRKDYERNRAGISTDEKLANGQIFIVKEDLEGRRYLECELAEGKPVTRVDIQDTGLEKAARLFKLSWCSTTHKLQGDQADVSVYIHEGSRAENKLVYVALSRGRSRNICVINTDTVMEWKVRSVGREAGGIIMSRSVKRLSVLAEYLKHLTEEAA